MFRPMVALFGLFLGLSALPAQADQLIDLISNQSALSVRYDLIKTAQKEILVQYYEYGRDITGLRGLALLQEAAQRGVKVKLLVDDMHSELTSADIAALIGVRQNSPEAKNFEVKVFNPLSSPNVFKQTYRDHSKRMIIDGEVIIIGGRNAAGGYFGQNSDKSTNLRDFEVAIRGKAAQAAREDYLTLWEQNKLVKLPQLYENSWDKAGLGAPCYFEAEAFKCPDDPMNQGRMQIEKSQKLINETLNSLRQEFSKRFIPSLDVLFANSEEVDVKFIANDPTKTMKHMNDRMEDQLLRYLDENAKESITIATPYLFPTEKTLATLEKLSKEKGIKIRILTNSLATTDSPLVHAGLLSILPRFAQMGVDIYEYKGPEILHSKVLVMDAGTDNAMTMTGSFNFDRRSALINREIGVLITGRDRKAVAARAAGELERLINRKSIASVQNGQLVNKQSLEDLLNSLGDNIADQRRTELKGDESLIHLFPDQI